MSTLVLFLNPWCINKLNWNVDQGGWHALLHIVNMNQEPEWQGGYELRDLWDLWDLWDYQGPPLENESDDNNNNNNTYLLDIWGKIVKIRCVNLLEWYLT